MPRLSIAPSADLGAASKQARRLDGRVARLASLKGDGAAGPRSGWVAVATRVVSFFTKGKASILAISRARMPSVGRCCPVDVWSRGVVGDDPGGFA